VQVVQPSREHRPTPVDPAASRAPSAATTPRAAAVPATAPARASTSRDDDGWTVDPRLGPVEVRRSRRRSRTVTAYREGGRTIVAIPARFTRAQEREWVRRMLDRLATQEQRRRPSDDQLVRRAAELSARYLGGRAVPSSVRWSGNQGRRWGSCTVGDGSIRISDRLRGMPAWVTDYVLLHELAHLLHAGHGPEFWAELEAYPRTERARGFLEGYSFAERAPGEDPVDGSGADDVADDTADTADRTDTVEAHDTEG
jgi:predicted metal-dependent hydrolase